MSSTCEYIKRKWGDRLPIELAKAIAEAKALENGLILISAGANTVRFLPPLIMQKEQID